MLDLTDETFGAIRALFPTGRRCWRGRLWFVRCDPELGGCGQEYQVVTGDVRSHPSLSCGCAEGPVLRRYDGPSEEAPARKQPKARKVFFRSKHPLYGVWTNMMRRCTDPRFPQFECYGGRGIKVCERWSNAQGFENFIDDMGDRPEGVTSAGRSGWWLERVDNDGSYAPENCKWATAKEQVNNRRRPNKSAI